MNNQKIQGAQRIVCLTEETTETLYLLGAQDRIVGISGFTVRPPQARREKPKVSAFTSANIDKIIALQPDLVLGFSDLQADIMAELVRAGLEVHIFNQRSIADILRMIATLGGLIAMPEKATALIDELVKGLELARQRATQLPRRPCVYFEEWDQPFICGIRWVTELIEIAGGIHCFAERSLAPLAKDRIIADAQEIIAKQPDLIIGSWCGKRFRPEQVCARPGWDVIPAVQKGHVYEIKSADILQPGPAALTSGLQALQTLIFKSVS